MPRIILQYPFIRHYAGSIFDLEINLNWDGDDRNLDRMPSKEKYLLPDGGKGYPADLSLSDTVSCPPQYLKALI